DVDERSRRLFGPKCRRRRRDPDDHEGAGGDCRAEEREGVATNERRQCGHEMLLTRGLVSASAASSLARASPGEQKENAPGRVARPPVLRRLCRSRSDVIPLPTPLTIPEVYFGAWISANRGRAAGGLPARAVGGLALRCSRHLCRVRTKVFPDFELHAVDFREEARDGTAVVDRIWLRLSQVGRLVLEPADTVQGPLQLTVVSYHLPSGTTSTIPRRPPSRRTCQYSIIERCRALGRSYR